MPEKANVNDVQLFLVDRNRKPTKREMLEGIEYQIGTNEYVHATIIGASKSRVLKCWLWKIVFQFKDSYSK